jgi:hypothetical protein
LDGATRHAANPSPNTPLAPPISFAVFIRVRRIDLAHSKKDIWDMPRPPKLIVMFSYFNNTVGLAGAPGH